MGDDFGGAGQDVLTEGLCGQLDNVAGDKAEGNGSGDHDDGTAEIGQVIVGDERGVMEVVVVQRCSCEACTSHS